ncbi:MAG: hypothetical protein IIC91_13025, partial [Chloroflexi bacterium]|nr:hypothetical protein [Chloroflexota bacterium]
MASEGTRALRRGGSPLIVAIVVALLAAALLFFVYDSSEPATVDADTGPGMALQFFPNTSAIGSPCTGKCVGVTDEAFSIDVVTSPAPPVAGFSAYRINITYSGVKLIAQDRVDENRVP